MGSAAHFIFISGSVLLRLWGPAGSLPAQIEIWLKEPGLENCLLGAFDTLLSPRVLSRVFLHPRPRLSASAGLLKVPVKPFERGLR